MRIPWPANLDQVASRLLETESLNEAFLKLPQPCHEVLAAIEMCVALDTTPNLEAVSRQLGSSTAVVASIVEQLSELLLIREDEGGGLIPIATFPTLLRNFGTTIDRYLDAAPLDILRPMSTKLGVRADGPKPEVVARIKALFDDRAAISAIIAAAPEDERQLLEEAARTNAMLYPHPVYLHSDSLGMWSVQRGLAWRLANGPVSMPLQVTLAVLGEGPFFVFHPTPPDIAVRSVEIDHVEAEAGRRLLRMVELVSNLIDAARASPIPLIKSGAVGVRTIRALAKDLYATEDEVQLALELALTERLLESIEPAPTRSRKKAPTEPSTLIPSELSALWQAADDSHRGGSLLRTWWVADYVPLAVHTAIDDRSRNVIPEFLRYSVIGVHIDTDGAITGVDDVVSLVNWSRPSLGIGSKQDVLQLVLREAELLGVLALGAASSIARGLQSGNAVTAASGVVSQAHTHATIGADLTAVVFGAPGPELGQFFDSVAIRESSGSATTWRFSQSSVRRAFDNGMSEDDVVEGLSRFSSSEVPQALLYLVKDVARTHGSIRVVPLGCVVVSTDEALVAEIASHRRLSKLGAIVLSPNVVGFGSAPDAVLTELRSAGYAPVQDDPNGAVAISRSSTVFTGSDYEVPSEPDFAVHADFLASERSDPPTNTGKVWDEVSEVSDRLVKRRFVGGAVSAIEYEGRVMVVHSARERGAAIEVWNNSEERYELLVPSSIRLSTR